LLSGAAGAWWRMSLVCAQPADGPKRNSLFVILAVDRVPVQLAE
jgi:hypothetical protein